MKKLRLIKPWRLRTIRQRLDCAGGWTENREPFTPCCGPEGDAEFSRRPPGVREAAGLCHARVANPNNAPYSTVAFISLNNIR